VAQSAPSRRRYDSRLRRERAEQTRGRIVAAGLQLAHERPVWDWRGLTIRAAAERAGVSERTVYRHFPGEREFHDAIMQRLEQEAAVTLEGMRLGEVADATARVFAHVASFPMVPRTPLEPTLTATDQRRRETLLKRLVTGWELTPAQATAAITWVIGLVEAAIREGRGPDDGPVASS